MRNSVAMSKTARGLRGSEPTCTSAVTHRPPEPAARPRRRRRAATVPSRLAAMATLVARPTVVRRAIRTSVVSLFALVVAIACDHPSSAAGPSTTGGGASKGMTMTGFSAAAAAFRDHASQALATKAIVLSPNGEAKMPHTYGGAWAFNAAPSNHADHVVRGWAITKGTVITTQQNFGLLLAEAGLWAKPQGDL